VTGVRWLPVRDGAALALAVALPTVVAVEVADRTVGIDSGSNWVFAFYLVVLAGLVAGGRRAALRRPAAALPSGALAALAAYAVLGVGGTLLRLATGRDPEPVALVFNGLIALSAGLVGALLATRPGRPTPG
jgi:protein-S-isoprenylcysteine O-methyltransferase Ste14